MSNTSKQKFTGTIIKTLNELPCLVKGDNFPFFNQWFLKGTKYYIAFKPYSGLFIGKLDDINSNFTIENLIDEGFKKKISGTEDLLFHLDLF